MDFTIINGVEVMKQFSRTDRIRVIFEKMPKASKKDLFDSYFEHYNDDTDTASVRATINSQVPKIMEAKEFLNKALNLDENLDTKFSVYLTKNKQHLKNYLEDYVFNIDDVKKHFIDTLKMYIFKYKISLLEEEKVQIEKLNELDLDQFIEGFVRIMGIALVYKTISPLSSSSDEDIKKIAQVDIKKLAKILKILNEDYLRNYLIELSIDKIKELSEFSQQHSPWGKTGSGKYKNYTIEKLKNSLEKIDDIKELVSEILNIIYFIARTTEL